MLYLGALLVLDTTLTPSSPRHSPAHPTYGFDRLIWTKTNGTTMNERRQPPWRFLAEVVDGLGTSERRRQALPHRPPGRSVGLLCRAHCRPRRRRRGVVRVAGKRCSFRRVRCFVGQGVPCGCRRDHISVHRVSRSANRPRAVCVGIVCVLRGVQGYCDPDTNPQC